MKSAGSLCAQIARFYHRLLTVTCGTRSLLLRNRASVRELVPHGSRAWWSDLAALQYATVARVIEVDVPPGSRVLDWGCGPGDFSAYLLGRGYRVDGCELFEPTDVTRIFDAGGGHYEFKMLLDGRSLPYADDTFDAVISLGVLEHVREGGISESEVLTEIHRVLRPRGLLIVAHLPNRRSLVENVIQKLALPRGFHEFKYLRPEIEGLLSTAGFEVLSYCRYGILPRNFACYLPRVAQQSRALAVIYDCADRVLTLGLSRFAQNQAVTARAL